MPRIFGLAISLIAAALMFFFPLCAHPSLEKKNKAPAEPIIFTGAGKVRGPEFWAAKLAPILLGFGFLLQPSPR
jgi:hypothetical protein